MPIARRTLLHEWRRFLPCAAAIACAMVLIAVQVALITGIFASAAVYIDASDADLWMGLRGTQSIELGRPIPRDADLAVRASADVIRLEPFRWVSADWRGPGRQGEESVFVSGIEPRAGGLIFSRALSPEMRRLLLEPGAVIVDRADLTKLGINVGGYGRVNGMRVHLVAAASGLRALGGVSLVASLDTARTLDLDNRTDRSAYYVAKLRPGVDPEEARERLAHHASPVVQIWTRGEFSRRAVAYWLFETGAGLGVLFISLVVAAAGGVIASQSLRSALAPSMKEYATLRAFGVSAGALRRLVIEKTLWLAAVAVLAASVAIVTVVGAARQADVPAALTTPGILAIAALLLIVASTAAFGATRLVSKLDTFALLR